MKAISLVLELLLILGGVLALSGLIVAQKPDAKKYIDKLVPFQALIGVGLLVLGVVLFLYAGPVAMFRMIKVNAFYGMVGLAMVFSAIILGMFFGMPQIAKWIPGDSPAEQKAMEISQKVAPYQAIVGIVALGAGLVGLLYTLGLVKLASVVGMN
ncbi:MAG TPA: hypothetical protein VFQ53_36070 [Kofleriaceae bacterium]|nr:hypothetical protein [Kofleriaceae bacterium]